MIEQNFGHKELYEVVLRAKTPMQFGSRYIEEQEPVLYFNNVNMAQLTENNHPVIAHGGWADLPRVIWDERTEVQFQIIDGVMSQTGFSILLSTNMVEKKKDSPLYINKREGPLELNGEHEVYLKHWPVDPSIKKTFIFDYERDSIQQKLYGRRIENKIDPFNPNKNLPCIQIFKDKNLTIPADISRKYVVDYYYKYEDEALIYSIAKERFNGLFTLEAKFYSKDENEGINYTNVLWMPKVRIVSNINLRLGERADPVVSNFNIIALPEAIGDSKNLIMEITRLGYDIDEEI